MACETDLARGQRGGKGRVGALKYLLGCASMWCFGLAVTQDVAGAGCAAMQAEKYATCWNPTQNPPLRMWQDLLNKS